MGNLMYIAEADQVSSIAVIDEFIHKASSTSFVDGQQVDIEVRRAARQINVTREQFLGLTLMRIEKGFYPAHQLNCMDERIKHLLGIGEKPQDLLDFEADLKQLFAQST